MEKDNACDDAEMWEANRRSARLRAEKAVEEVEDLNKKVGSLEADLDKATKSS